MTAKHEPPVTLPGHGRSGTSVGTTLECQEFAWIDSARAGHRDRLIAHWDRVARQIEGGHETGVSYHRRLARVYRNLIPKGRQVLELGCGPGRLLGAMEPSYGVGVDLSAAMVEIARRNYPRLHVFAGDAHELAIEGTFDAVILSDLVNELWDLQEVLEQIAPLTTRDTRLVFNFYSRLWEFPLRVARSFGLADPPPEQNWFRPDDIDSILRLAGFEAIRSWREILFPAPFPLLAGLLNRVAVRLPPFSWCGLANFVVARNVRCTVAAAPKVSVIVPMRNEAGMVRDIVQRVPEMTGGTELILVEGGSTDDTLAVATSVASEHPERQIRVLKQPGRGKGDAVRAGFHIARGDIVAILDADLTTPPEDLPRFIAALVTGQAEFVNGVRLVYPMHPDAMRFLNLVANTMFGLAFSWVLGQRVRDTLCGTKVLWRRHWLEIERERQRLGDLDPYGDFDLLFGAAGLNLKIVDLPVRYRERSYGTTNIDRWSGGWLLTRMLMRGMRQLTFM